MRSMDKHDWASLRHAYGEASNIPALLEQLKDFPPCEDYRAEPYLSLWSALCHQGDVYPASYAAMPTIIELMEASPARATWSALLLVVSIEIARATKRGPEIVPDLAGAYTAALQRLPALVAAMATQTWDELMTRTAAAAIAVSKGQVELGSAILELTPDRDCASWGNDMSEDL